MIQFRPKEVAVFNLNNDEMEVERIFPMEFKEIFSKGKTRLHEGYVMYSALEDGKIYLYQERIQIDLEQYSCFFDKVADRVKKEVAYSVENDELADDEEGYIILEFFIGSNVNYKEVYLTEFPYLMAYTHQGKYGLEFESEFYEEIDSINSLFSQEVNERLKEEIDLKDYKCIYEFEENGGVALMLIKQYVTNFVN